MTIPDTIAMYIGYVFASGMLLLLLIVGGFIAKYHLDQRRTLPTTPQRAKTAREIKQLDNAFYGPSYHRRGAV